MDGGAWCRLLSTRSQSRTRLSDFTFTFITDSKGREWMIINYADCESESASPSHSVVSDSLPPHGLYSPWNSPAQNTVVGSLSLLQGLFPMQGSNPCLPQCRWALPAEPQGKPKNTRVGSLSLLQWIFPNQEWTTDCEGFCNLSVQAWWGREGVSMWAYKGIRQTCKIY